MIYKLFTTHLTSCQSRRILKIGYVQRGAMKGKIVMAQSTPIKQTPAPKPAPAPSQKPDSQTQNPPQSHLLDPAPGLRTLYG